MKYLKEYKKPKFTIIRISIDEQLLAGSGEGEGDDEVEIGGGGGHGGLDIKAQTFRIFDDSFDDLSSVDESDYTTTTNTIEVW